MKMTIITLSLVFSSLALQAEDKSAIAFKCEERLHKSFNDYNSDLNRVFKGYYACSQKAKEIQERIYSTRSKSEFLALKIRGKFAIKSRKTTLYKELVDSCRSLGEIAALPVGKRLSAEYAIELIQGCYINGWASPQSNELESIVKETLE